MSICLDFWFHASTISQSLHQNVNDSTQFALSISRFFLWMCDLLDFFIISWILQNLLTCFIKSSNFKLLTLFSFSSKRNVKFVRRVHRGKMCLLFTKVIKSEKSYLHRECWGLYIHKRKNLNDLKHFIDQLNLSSASR
jgi:hypothetical protein